MRNDVQTTSRSSSAARQPGTPAGGPARYSDATLTPPVDVLEDAGGITLYADLPGVSREQLNLQVESDTLTIEAEANLSVPPELTSSHTEVGLARFRRVFTLSKELDTERVSAELAQGVLKLRIPKAQHAQPRRIQVQVA
ncbi:Hsp20/alpha crystallin family protein [Acidovorax sp. Leaf160]|uniref:Hsp20/alpha crystallin family protein n=1 Tax=Acidovorax sp. Leaf160 TaxID=1736280 RepID=UPI0007008A1A|nr:Hsp20/alpha crystallin family protein [Acidovorax sp. Leaf160]KQR63009.1 heat-shock protein Hsp20 [Acidovorax sp. Leaf160]